MRDPRAESKTHSSGGKEGYRGGGHDRRRNPPNGLCEFAVHVPTHDLMASGDQHHDDKEWGGNDTIYYGDQDEELDRVDVEETQCRSHDRSNGDETIEDWGLAH